MSDPDGRWPDAIAERLDGIRAQGRWRQVRTLDQGSLRATLDDGRKVTVFSSNDYLGLSQHPALAAAAIAAIEQYGTGSGSARLIVGGRPVHDELEAELAAWKQTEAALVFPTGFAANLGVLTALASCGGAAIFSDELNHASIIDGARLSRCEVYVYPHADLGALAQLLERSTAPRPIIVSDSVFSMDGDAAPVAELLALAREHGAIVVLDEAHSVLAEPLDRPGDDVVVVGTMSKTLGSLGGFVCASRPIVELCVNAARSFIFTTAPTPADCAAALAAVRIVRSDEGDVLRARLRSHARVLRPGHDSPIVPVVVGEEVRAVEASEHLLDAGFLVPAIRPPTVAPGTCRLRITVSAAHEHDDVVALRDTLRELGLIDG